MRDFMLFGCRIFFFDCYTIVSWFCVYKLGGSFVGDECKLGVS
jgi:hypothetical protein